MKFYEYDINGFLVGWYDEEIQRPNSTAEEPNVKPNLAKWNGSEWVEDTKKESDDLIQDNIIREKKQQENSTLDYFNPKTATLEDVKSTLAALISYLKNR